LDQFLKTREHGHRIMDFADCKLSTEVRQLVAPQFAGQLGGGHALQ
jgi:hypothetical protein